MTFEDQKRRLAVKAGRAGYTITRRHTHPYGFDLEPIRGYQAVASGTIRDLHEWLDNQLAEPQAGDDRRAR